MKKTLFISLALVALLACNKEEPTTATITVVDQNEVAVAGIDVELYVKNPTNAVREDGIEQIKATNASGVAVFDFSNLYELGQAGFAVLDIKVGAGAAESIIKIEEEKNNEQTVVCTAC